MFDFYLYNKSYIKANTEQIEKNLQTLNELAIVEHKEEDFFYFNESIWNINTASGNFSDVVFTKIKDKHFNQIVIPKLFQAIKTIREEFSTLEEFDKASYHIYKAFYGAIFNTPVSERYITSNKTYTEFKNKCLFTLTSRTLWERKKLLFKKLILCPEVESNLNSIGAKYLSQIVSRLLMLDNFAVSECKDREFDYHKANALTSLRISPESKETMSQDKYYNSRLFKTPDGSSECFDFHIKTGDLRIYFLPKSDKIYIGYIGKHLPTVNY